MMKEGNEKAGLKFYIQKTKIVESGHPHAHQHECPLAHVTAMLTGQSDVL